jgi:ankyrin repeat protein
MSVDQSISFVTSFLMFSKLFQRNRDNNTQSTGIFGTLFTARGTPKVTENVEEEKKIKIEKQTSAPKNSLSGFLTGRRTSRATQGSATDRNTEKKDSFVAKVVSAITPRRSSTSTDGEKPNKDKRVSKKEPSKLMEDKIPTIEEESFLEVKQKENIPITIETKLDEELSPISVKKDSLKKVNSFSKLDTSPSNELLTKTSSKDLLEQLQEDPDPESSEKKLSKDGIIYKGNGTGEDDQVQTFHKAAALGDLQKLKKFLKGKDAMELLMSTDKDQSTALHKAASKNKFQAVKLLLDSGAQVDCLDKVSSTPLHWACAGGNLESTQMLCKYNAQVNIRDKYGYAPLHLCLRKKAYRCADFLLLMGADINFKRGDGSTVLHVAAEKGDLSTLQWLMSKPKIIANRRDKAGDTPVMLSAFKGHVKLVEFLMKKDLQSCRIRNEQNENLLHKASSGGHKQVIFLIASLSPVTCSAMMNEQDLWGRTPLHQAVRDKQFQIVKTLLTMGADMDTQDNAGNTPVHDAVKVQDTKILKFLVQSGCRSDVKNKNGETAKQQAKKVGLESFFND